LIVAPVATGGYIGRMKQVSIKEAKDRLPALVREAEGGARIVITRNGKPVADVVPHEGRKGGVDFEGLERWKRENGIPTIVREIPADFDDPLPEDFLITPITFPDEVEGREEP
jgi:prevent-host-death family protein